MLSTMRERAVTDLRRSRRFNVIHSVPAQFAGNAVEIVNLSVEGLRIRHATFVKIHTRGPVQVDNPENREIVALLGRVLWSRLSTVADATGKYLYVSGVLIENAAPVAGALGCLIRFCATVDRDSMEKKWKAIEERAQRRTAAMTPATPELRVSRDQLLLIREAREQLEANPEQIKEWCSRAKVLASENGDESQPLPYPQDILAIWGYLGGHVELDQVALVYELTSQRARA